MRDEVVKVFERIIPQHRPALESLDGHECARRGWVAFKRGEPLDDWQDTYMCGII